MQNQITSKELAPILGITQGGVQRLVIIGVLSFVRIGKVHYFDSQQAVEEYRNYKENRRRDRKDITAEENECRKIIIDTMHKYLDTLEHNDDLAAQHDKLSSIEAPSNEQLDRIKELEEVEIPAGIEKERREERIVRTFISVLDVETGWAQHRHMLEMRFLCCMELKEIAREVFGDNPDFAARERQYHKNACSTMNYAVIHIARTLGTKRAREIINQQAKERTTS